MPQKTPRLTWVGEVFVSAQIAAKIRGNTGLNPAEIARLVQSPPPRIGRFVRDESGSRLYVVVRTAAGQDVLVVLHSLAADVWLLASAYVQDRKRGAR